ncbi:cob(I)yrinic acid a,c-diamide adenosyltransferase [bacterium]|nr:cob(I)yrinic acid a,c-diamide adenosyltransferase [bacterium]
MDENQIDPKPRIGIIQIYWGDGKGKTTAAIGQAIRALGQGLRVYMAQFLKPQNVFSGEMAILNNLGPNLIFRRPNRTSFLDNSLSSDVKDRERGLISEEMAYVRELINLDSCDMFVFDELITALNIGVIEEPDLINLLSIKRPQCEMILTGLRPNKTLIDMADIITEMRMQKHPYQSGLEARRGIEY